MAEERGIAPGELVEVSVTHEIKIRGDKTWVGVRFVGALHHDETHTEATERLDAELQQAIVRQVISTVQNTEKHFYNS